MRKIILILALFFIISCKSQKSTEKNHHCDISETENLRAFDSLYVNLDTTKVFKNKLKEFEKNKTEVLLCQFPPNMKRAKFTEIKTINDKLIYYNSSTDKQILLKNSDIELLSSSIRTIERKYYYEQCDEYVSNDAFYLMLIKRDGEIVSKYFIHGNLSFEKTEGNLNTLKSIFEIMYRNSFK